MFTFDPNTLYSFPELRERLEGIVSLDTLLDRLGLRDRRNFRDALWGWEVLEASRQAEPFAASSAAEVFDIGPSPSLKRSRKANSKPGQLRMPSSRDISE